MSQIGQAALMEAWRPLAEKALKGASFEALNTATADGAVLFPLYGPADPVFSGRPRLGDWQVVQRVDADTGAAAQAREDLENGAGALALVFAGAPGAHGRGLTAARLDALDAALEGVLLEHCGIILEAGGRGVEALALVHALAERRHTRPAELHAGIDPLGAFAATGAMAPWDAVSERLAAAMRAAERFGAPGTVLCADGRPLAEAGATPAQELAFALAALAAMVRALDAQGLGPDVTLPRTRMALCATQDQFATIAKLRAARRLHALVAEACGMATPLSLSATTAMRMLSFSDPQTNLIRLTIAAFAAGVGGADDVTVLPFDAGASAFARRMARNIQTLLLEEAHVTMLADPAAGAGAVEAATDALAEAAWQLFQEHEREGLLRRIADGTVAAAVREAAQREAAAVDAGERVIIGVTRHPPAEPVPVAPVPPVAPPQERSHAVSGAGFEALVAAAAAGASLANLVDGPVGPAGSAAAATPLSAPTMAPSRLATAFEG